METAKDLGKEGEELAVHFLLKRGHTLLHRNWRYSHYELDIITVEKGILHFVEVKTRSSEKFALPEASVKTKKMRDLFRAAEEFLYRQRQYKDFRIDILSICIPPGGEPKYFLIEDVYL